MSYRQYTIKEVEFIKKNAHKGGRWLSDEMDIPYYSIRSMMSRYKIKSGIGEFKKGFEPWNKGKRGIHLSPKSEFKKGNLPHNTKKDGYITIRVDSKTQRPYKYIRRSLGKWVLLSRHVWEKHNGPIPKGMLVVYKDSDPLNCNIDNLELISRAENAKRNVNREKAGKSLKKAWESTKIREAYGLPLKTGFRSKYKAA